MKGKGRIILQSYLYNFLMYRDSQQKPYLVTPNSLYQTYMDHNYMMEKNEYVIEVEEEEEEEEEEKKEEVS